MKVYSKIEIAESENNAFSFMPKKFVSESDYLTEVQALKADLEALVKMYSPKIKRNCQHDDPSWCNEFCNDYGHLARQIGDKNGIKHE